MEPVQPVPLSAGKKNNCDQAPKTQMTLMTLPLVISCGFTLFWDPQGSTFLSRPQAITQAARKSCTSRSPVPAHHGTMRMKSMKSVHRTWQEVVTLCWFKLCNCAALPAALPADSVQNGSHEGWSTRKYSCHFGSRIHGEVMNFKRASNQVWKWSCGTTQCKPPHKNLPATHHNMFVALDFLTPIRVWPSSSLVCQPDKPINFHLTTLQSNHHRRSGTD